MINKKIISIFIISITIMSFLFTSCDNTPQQNTESNGTNDDMSINMNTEENFEDAVARLEANLPEVNYDGDTFTFLVHEADGNGYWGSYEIFAEEETGEAINDAVYRRNRTIEDRLGIEIKEVRTNDVNSLATRTIRADDPEYDCIMPRITGAASMATSGYLVSYDQLPYIDLTNPWWDQNANSMLSIGNRLFFTVGDLSIVDKDSTWVIMFNKTVALNNGLENFYNLVREDKWTMEKFYSIIRDAARDLNGDGVMDENDLAGFLSDTGVILAMFYNTGETVIKKDADDFPYLTLNTERAITAEEKTFEIFGDKTAAVLAEDLPHIANPWSDGLNKMFQEDRGLFYAIGLTVMHKMRSMNSDFGVLPFPKLNENQSQYSHSINPWCSNSIAVPVTVRDREKTSIVLEAMSAEAKYTVIPAYYDVTITNKTIRDEESAEMLNLILSTRSFDLGFIFNWGDIGYMPNSNFPNTGRFVSTYERLESRAVSDMEKTIDAFKELYE